jgi:mono/diheme cytochrome c family protein
MRQGKPAGWRGRVARGAALAAVLALALPFLPDGSDGAEGAAPGDVERGAYLFAAADCEACHTDAKRGGKPLAGGRPLATPFGTFYSPNITPDRRTGIGVWTDGEFIRAFRAGRSRGGAHLYPVFPYPSFTGMTDQDLVDIKAYLFTREAVAQENKPQEVRFPFGWRFLLAFWNMLFLEEGPLKPVAGKDEEWNRGRYLAEAVAHCGECHTPRNWFGAVERSRALAGVKAGPDGQNAPNITPDPASGIGKWSLEDITTLLKDGQTPDFDYVGSGMAEVVKGTGKLTDQDRRAIAVYIKSLPPQPGPPRTK